MKSLVTDGWKVMPYFFIAYLIVQMIHDGEWWWLVATLLFATVLCVAFEVWVRWDRNHDPH